MFDDKVQPKLVDLSEYAPKPKKISVKDIKYKTTITKNIVLFLVIVLGFMFVYYKYKHKDIEKLETKNKILELNNYVTMKTVDNMIDSKSDNKNVK